MVPNSTMTVRHSTDNLPAWVTTFHITCECGEIRQGERSFVFQILTCSRCSKRMLIFPISRILHEPTADRPPLSADTSVPVWNWRKPLLIASGSAFLLVALLVPLIFWGIQRKTPTGAITSPQDQAQRLLDAGWSAVREGDLLTALQRFRAIPENALPTHEVRRWKRITREVSAVCDLSFESIPEMLQPLPGLPDRIWKTSFQERYAGRTIIFDALMHRNAAGQYSLDYDLSTPEGPIDIGWNHVQRLADLPLTEPVRMLFAIRLASAERSPAARWHIECQPDSLVLFTDADVLRGTAIPSVDAELRAVLTRQAQWLDEFSP